MKPAPDSSPAKTGGWLEPLVWSLVMVALFITAACLSAEVREVLLQGAAYLFTFFSTPFVLEASTAFIGLCVVMIINNRRIAKEGDGWVVMEVRKEPDTEVPAVEKQRD